VYILTAEDCFRLGAVAYFNQDYYHTVMWVTEAINVWESEQQKTIDKSTLLDYLSYSLYMVSLTHCLNKLTYKINKNYVLNLIGGL